MIEFFQIMKFCYRILKPEKSNNNIIVEAGVEKTRKKKIKKKDEVLMEPVITPRNIFKSFTSIPTELKTLCLVDLCTWAALCTFLIYYTGELYLSKLILCETMFPYKNSHDKFIKLSSLFNSNIFLVLN